MILKDKWGRRGLAYPVKGATEGSFVVYYYEMDPLKLKEVETQLRIMKNVLRYIVIKPPKNYQVVKYSEAYEQWLKDRENVGEKKAREREEKLQDQVAKKAKRQAQRKKDDAKPAEALSEEVLTEKLEKLISDDQVDL
jgi:ribosomal protein S6